MAAADDSPSTRTTLPRGRRYGIRALLVLGTLLAILSVFAIWANRQVLDAGNWSDTSSQLLEEPAIREQVASIAVDQVFAQVDVQGALSGALPPRLAPLAGPATNALRDGAEKRANKLLERPKFQRLWQRANFATANEFIAIAENRSVAIRKNGNAIVLDLRALVGEIAQTIGLPGSRLAGASNRFAVVKVMDADQVDALQKGVKLLKGLGTVLPILALLAFAGAVALATGRRRETLLFVGVNLIVAGLIVLVARRIAGNQLVDAIGSTDAAQDSARAVWQIGTAMLHDIAVAQIVLGIPVVIAAWLAGPQRLPVAFRTAIAPTAQHTPFAIYGAVAALVLVVFAWGPIPATRTPLPMLVIALLAAAGAWTLQRQVTTEHPVSPPPA